MFRDSELSTSRIVPLQSLTTLSASTRVEIFSFSYSSMYSCPFWVTVASIVQKGVGVKN